MKPDMYYLRSGLDFAGSGEPPGSVLFRIRGKGRAQAAPEPPPRPVPPSLIARDVTLPAAVDTAPALSAHGPVLASATVRAVAPPARPSLTAL